ncbi:MAG: type II secretion system protein GspJ [Shimia sp.]
MAQGPRAPEAGVTLIEVIVALGLFAMIAVAGFSMLDSILRVRAGTEGRLERLADVDRALLLLSRDVQSKNQAPLAWDGARLAFVRDTTPVAYRLDGGVLRRAAPSDTVQAVLGDVRGFEVRALDSRGAWHDTWPVEAQRLLGVPPSLVGLEVRLELPEGGVVRVIDLPRELAP